MLPEKTESVIVGGGQAGIAMSEHLTNNGVAHLVLERGRIAERWRSERWDSLVTNGPAWHDRFPGMEFACDADAFPGKEMVAEYFAGYAKKISAPVYCGVEVKAAQKNIGARGFRIETSTGVVAADNIVAATGSFQTPVIPAIIPKDEKIRQLHSADYRNPEQISDGAILIIGAGSSGVQIADELARAGRRVYLSVGRHDRPFRNYRGRDFVWWLGVLGKWDDATPGRGGEHVTIAVSGANGGSTVDFRKLAARGIILTGRAEGFKNGALHFADDIAENIARGDENYLSLMDEADKYICDNGLDFPAEEEARVIDADPPCMQKPLRKLNLANAGVNTIIFATGFGVDYSWLKSDTFDESGRPKHQRGVSRIPGIYFLGLPWQSRRGSSFIWGVWHDAKFIADHIVTQQKYLSYRRR